MIKKIIVLLLIALLLVGCGGKEKKAEATPTAKIEFYFAPLPPFAKLFSKLDYIETTEFDSAVSSENYKVEQDVLKSAFALGVLSADAVVLTKARNKTKLAAISQAMIEYSKLIAIDEDVLMLADELQSLIKADEWDKLENALDKYKSKVELSLYDSQEYDLFTLLQLGGWVEGLNKTCFLLSLNYKAEKTAIIDEKGILNQLINNLKNVKNPELKKMSYYTISTTNLTKIKEIIYSGENSIYSLEKVKQITTLTDEIKKSFH
ncbi:MAG: hypothetical protein PHR06_00335 [Candidatus Cloacimonetes bacterium]|nr:hypothetical protein [Candidatus Cloacimonadota bacterium]